jgi:hypothetical protein
MSCLEFIRFSIVKELSFELARSARRILVEQGNLRHSSERICGQSFEGVLKGR